MRAHLKPDSLVKAHALVDEHPDKVEVGVARCGVGDLDLLEAAFHELNDRRGRDGIALAKLIRQPTSIDAPNGRRTSRRKGGGGPSHGIQGGRWTGPGGSWGRGRTRLKKRVFCSTVIGLTRAWLPSRRSELSQRGGAVIVREGHVRSGMSIGLKGLACEKRSGRVGERVSERRVGLFGLGSLVF